VFSRVPKQREAYRIVLSKLTLERGRLSVRIGSQLLCLQTKSVASAERGRRLVQPFARMRPLRRRDPLLQKMRRKLSLLARRDGALLSLRITELRTRSAFGSPYGFTDRTTTRRD
jgi:hypothetical protein